MTITRVQLLFPMKIIWIEETGSTNSAVLEYGPATEEGVILATHSQTRGRGQKGNSWESEAGKNLSFSAMWRPNSFPARNQFSISEVVALAVVDLLAGIGIESKVKWPNDVYVGNKKICGILIEHSVVGMDLDRTVAGVGININQQQFISDAPNPVSATQLTGRVYDLESLLERYTGILEAGLKKLDTEKGREETHHRFMMHLWRGDGGSYGFRDCRTGECYLGIIRGVAPMGFLSVENASTGKIREYAFKEVEFLL